MYLACDTNPSGFMTKLFSLVEVLVHGFGYWLFVPSSIFVSQVCHVLCGLVQKWYRDIATPLLYPRYSLPETALK